MCDKLEARKKAAEKGWLGEPQPERGQQWGIYARKALRAAEERRKAELEANPGKPSTLSRTIS